MNKIQETPCAKCGDETRIHWETQSCPEWEKIKSGILTKTCIRCGYSQTIDDLETIEIRRAAI